MTAKKKPDSVADTLSDDDFLDALGESHKAAPRKPVVYPLIWDEQLNETAQASWLIDGVLPTAGLAVLYGDPGVCKTFLALDWALSVGCRPHWAGRAVKNTQAVYVAAEGWNGIKSRVEAWKEKHMIFDSDRAGCAFLGRALNLLNLEEARTFADAIAETGATPGLIVIDTLARNTVGMDENTAKDMGLLVSACDLLRERFGATVLILHHANKSKEFGPSMRGNGALKGAADTVIYVEEFKDGIIEARCEKQKEGGKFKPVRFKLAPLADSAVLAFEVAQKKEKQASLLEQ